MSDLVVQFCSITGASASVASSLLAACNNSLEMAINMHMEGVQTHEDDSCSNEISEAGPSATTSSTTSTSSSSLSETGAGNSNGNDDSDNVRAPIPPKQEQLIEPGYEGYAIDRSSSRSASGSGLRNPHKARVRSVFDGFRNFNNETDTNDGRLPVSRKKKRTLEELFKPPLELIHKGDFQSARDSATAAKKWLLVNIQDAGEFQCQLLNRDVWSNDSVKSILREHFIFWQQYKESEEAQRYMTFYPVKEWPYVSVLDPRTGEKLIEWNKLDSSIFCELVAEFLSHQTSLDGPSDQLAPPLKKPKISNEKFNILDANEDDQIALAIKASLAAEESPVKSLNVDSDSDSELLFEDDDSNISAIGGANSQKMDMTKTPSKEADCDERPKWEDYLGNENDPVSSIMIRFPDGQKESKKLPSSSKLLAILLFVASRGFPLESYEIVTNFPRRIISELDDKLSLFDHGLFPQETIFIQKR